MDMPRKTWSATRRYDARAILTRALRNRCFSMVRAQKKHSGWYGRGGPTAVLDAFRAGDQPDSLPEHDDLSTSKGRRGREGAPQSGSGKVVPSSIRRQRATDEIPGGSTVQHGGGRHGLALATARSLGERSLGERLQGEDVRAGIAAPSRTPRRVHASSLTPAGSCRSRETGCARSVTAIGKSSRVARSLSASQTRSPSGRRICSTFAPGGGGQESPCSPVRCRFSARLSPVTRGARAGGFAQGTLRLVICSLVGLDPRGDRDRLDQAPDCLNVLDVEGPVRARVMLFNDTSHYSMRPGAPD